MFVIILFYAFHSTDLICNFQYSVSKNFSIILSKMNNFVMQFSTFVRLKRRESPFLTSYNHTRLTSFWFFIVEKDVSLGLRFDWSKFSSLNFKLLIFIIFLFLTFFFYFFLTRMHDNVPIFFFLIINSVVRGVQLQPKFFRNFTYSGTYLNPIVINNLITFRHYRTILKTPGRSVEGNFHIYNCPKY